MLTKCQALFQFLRMFKCIECYATEADTDSPITCVPIHSTWKQHLASLEQEMCVVFFLIVYPFVLSTFCLCSFIFC